MEPFPDKFFLYDSDALTKLGCSSAIQYHRTAAFEVFPDERGGVWYCMRQTLATYCKEAGKWKATPDNQVRKPTPGPGLTQKLRALFTARGDPSLFVPLVSSGCAIDGSIDLESLRGVSFLAMSLSCMDLSPNNSGMFNQVMGVRLLTCRLLVSVVPLLLFMAPASTFMQPDCIAGKSAWPRQSYLHSAKKSTRDSNCQPSSSQLRNVPVVLHPLQSELLPPLHQTD